MKRLIVLLLSTFSIGAFAGAQVVCSALGSKKDIKNCHKSHKQVCKMRGYKYDKKSGKCDVDKPTSKHKKCLKRGGTWSVSKEQAGYSIAAVSTDNVEATCSGETKGKKKKRSKDQKKYKKLVKLVDKIKKLRKAGKIDRADKKQAKLIKKACKTYSSLGAEIPKYLVEAGVVCEK